MITIAEIREQTARLKRSTPPADDAGPYLWDELERRILELSPSPAALKYAVDWFIDGCDQVTVTAVAQAIHFAMDYEQEQL